MKATATANAAIMLLSAFLPGSLWMSSTAHGVFSEQGAMILNRNYSARSVSLADIDNDGDLDAFFQGGGTTNQKLLRNTLIDTGTLSFIDISTMLPSAAGVAPSACSIATWIST